MFISHLFRLRKAANAGARACLVGIYKRAGAGGLAKLELGRCHFIVFLGRSDGCAACHVNPIHTLLSLLFKQADFLRCCGDVSVSGKLAQHDHQSQREEKAV